MNVWSVCYGVTVVLQDPLNASKLVVFIRTHVITVRGPRAADVSLKKTI
jgi:hypothetical protein